MKRTIGLLKETGSFAEIQQTQKMHLIIITAAATLSRSPALLRAAVLWSIVALMLAVVHNSRGVMATSNVLRVESFYVDMEMASTASCWMTVTERLTLSYLSGSFKGGERTYRITKDTSGYPANLIIQNMTSLNASVSIRSFDVEYSTNSNAYLRWQYNDTVASPSTVRLSIVYVCNPILTREFDTDYVKTEVSYHLTDSLLSNAQWGSLIVATLTIYKGVMISPSMPTIGDLNITHLSIMQHGLGRFTFAKLFPNRSSVEINIWNSDNDWDLFLVRWEIPRETDVSLDDGNDAGDVQKCRELQMKTLYLTLIIVGCVVVGLIVLASVHAILYRIFVKTIKWKRQFRFIRLWHDLVEAPADAIPLTQGRPFVVTLVDELSLSSRSHSPPPSSSSQEARQKQATL